MPKLEDELPLRGGGDVMVRASPHAAVAACGSRSLAEPQCGAQHSTPWARAAGAARESHSVMVCV